MGTISIFRPLRKNLATPQAKLTLVVILEQQGPLGRGNRRRDSLRLDAEISNLFCGHFGGLTRLLEEKCAASGDLLSLSGRERKKKCGPSFSRHNGFSAFPANLRLCLENITSKSLQNIKVHVKIPLLL